MAINRLPSGNYRARLTGADGRTLSKTYPTKLEAERQLLQWKIDKSNGQLVTNQDSKLTVDEFFRYHWFDKSIEDTGSGWKGTRRQQYEKYIKPILGHIKLSAVKPYMIKHTLKAVSDKGMSLQLQKHIYSLLRKFFTDVVEDYHVLTVNPVLRKYKPVVPLKTAPNLNLTQVRKLLQHVDGKKYGVGIWLQIFLGLRYGELAGLRWSDVDLEMGIATIKRVYVKLKRRVGNPSKRFRDFPKGKKQREIHLPPEMLTMLRREKIHSTSIYVVPSAEGEHLQYSHYLHTLKKYIQELELPSLGTHGLKHSTPKLYEAAGASQEDIKDLFQHSSLDVTKRYLHGWNSRLGGVAKVIELFPNVKNDHESTTSTSNSNLLN